MRTLILCFIFVLAFQLQLLSQKTATSEANRTVTEKGEDFDPLTLCNTYPKTYNPLTTASFNKMMRNDFRYAILGTKTPVSGFKLETNNPSVTLSGNAIVKNDFLASLQVTASTQNSISEIFSQEKLNGTFSASIGLNFLVNRFQKGLYNITPTQKILKHAVIGKYAQAVSLKLDTLLVYTVIGQQDFSKMVAFKEVVTAVNAFHGQYVQANSACPITETLLEDITRAVLKKYSGFEGTDDDLLQTFKVGLAARSFPDLASLEKKLIEASPLAADVRKNGQKLIDQVNDSCISIFKDIWGIKRVCWINLSPTLSNSSLTMYDTINKKTYDTTSFLFGIQGSFNFLFKFNQNFRFVYGKLGFDVGRVNSIPDLKKFTYQNTTTLNSSTSTVTANQKTGTAYKGDLHRGLGWDVFFEFYAAVFKNSAIPGLYLKPMYLHGDPWITKDRFSLDLGVIWNLANSDKTKNVVSIVPYVNWSNLANNTTASTAQLFSAGVKFGIPISLGN